MSLKGGAIDAAKDLLRGGPLFTARAAVGSTLPLGDGQTIRVRRGTSDLVVVRQVWRDEQYVIPQEKQVARLKHHKAAIDREAGFVSVDSAVTAYTVTATRADTGSRVVTVDDCFAMVEGEMFAVKVDVEGFEDDLFAANTGWLDRVALVYIEPHDHIFPDRGTSRNFQAEMGRRNFDLLIRGENLIYSRREEQTT